MFTVWTALKWGYGVHVQTVWIALTLGCSSGARCRKCWGRWRSGTVRRCTEPRRGRTSSRPAPRSVWRSARWRTRPNSHSCWKHNNSTWLWLHRSSLKVNLHWTKANFFFDICRYSMWTLKIDFSMNPSEGTLFSLSFRSNITRSAHL